MKYEQITVILIFHLIFALSVSGQTEQSRTGLNLTKKDKRQILRQVFENGIKKLITSTIFNQCLTPVVNNEKVFLIKSEEKQNLYPQKIGDYRFRLLPFSEINKEVNQNNGFCYFNASVIQVNSLTAAVLLNRIVDRIYRFENSSKYTRWIYGEGYNYKVKKFNNKWRIISSEKTIISS